MDRLREALHNPCDTPHSAHLSCSHLPVHRKGKAVAMLATPLSTQPSLGLQTLRGGRYRCIREISVPVRGSSSRPSRQYSRVYQAKDLQTGELVVLKHPNLSLSVEEMGFAQQLFVRERDI